MSNIGASASYRGYRVQALYALRRILEPGLDNSLVFHPEGIEDLDLELNDQLIEVVQVKSYDDLVLSNLSPNKPNSFFRRILELLEHPVPPKVKLANFGNFSEEMRLAWEGDETYRSRILQKLSAFGYGNEAVEKLFEHVELVKLNEEEEERKVYSQLEAQITGIDPANAFDLLHFWLYTKSERREKIAYVDLIEKIQSVGRFLSQRHHYHQEWFTSIQPIEDNPIAEDRVVQLREEFYAGVSARYEHIVAGLDLFRAEKLAEIKRAFQKSNVVIVHAASGQGKTTLAYRFIHENYPDSWRFSIQLVENRQHATRIAAALASHAKAVEAPILVYLDVSPHDTDWPELIRGLLEYGYLHFLVTIREEDFRRANIYAAFEYVSLDLAFDKAEARLIYERAIEDGHRIKQLNFDDTWDEFGGNGPLMEFVYFLTQTITLQQRLREQVNRIRHEVREKKLSSDELHLLRIVAVASANEARIHIPSLLTNLDLPEPSLTLDLFEKEYLLKVTPDNEHIVGLHPIRSRILTELLTEPGVMPWNKVAAQTLPLIPEEDWELFIFNSFVHYSEESSELLKIIENLQPRSWTGLAAFFRSLQWTGLKEYLEQNTDAIEASYDLFGQAWYFIMDLNFSGQDAPDIEGWWTKIGDLIPKENQLKIEEIRRNQTPKDSAMERAAAWLGAQDGTPIPPSSKRDWSAIAELFYWSYRFGQNEKSREWLSDDATSNAKSQLSLADFSEFSLALYLYDLHRYEKLFQANVQQIEKELADDYDIVALEEDGDTLIIHFLTYPEDEHAQLDRGRKSGKSLHDKTIERIQLVRQLFPKYEKYGSRGYGHQLPGLFTKHDDTIKTGIAKAYLPPKWPLRANGIATGLVQIKFRLDTWDEYLGSLIDARERIVACLSEVQRGVARFLEREKPYNILQMEVFNRGEWDQCRDLSNQIPILPKSAVDQWGMSQPEGNLSQDIKELEKILPISILAQIYNPYLEASRKYFASVNAFMLQSLYVLVISHQIGKHPDPSPERQAGLARLDEKKIALNSVFLSNHNLVEATVILNAFQREFRNLFGHRLDLEKLVALEKKETELLTSLKYIWYYFAYRPRTATANAIRQIPARVTAEIQKLLNRTSHCLETFRSNDVRGDLIGFGVQWDNSPTIWIKLDVDDPMMIYENVEALIHQLRGELGVIEREELEHYLIEDNLRFTVIIPTVRGKMINRLVWPLITEFTITKDEPIEEKPWAYMQQEIPWPLLEDLGVPIWEDEEIKMANELAGAVAALGLVTSLIGKLQDVPNAMDASSERLQSFLQIRSEELSQLLQKFIDMGTFLLDKFNNLTENEQRGRTQLTRAVSLLSEIYRQVLPSSEFEGSHELKLDELNSYSERLQNVTLIVEEIKLLWIGDVIFGIGDNLPKVRLM